MLVVAIVAGIGIVLFRESMLSIREFGLGFWVTDSWDPVSGEFGARPFIWGTLYSSVLALLIVGADLARHRHVHLRAVPARAPAAAHVPHGTARGDSVDRLRPVGTLRARAGGARNSRTAVPDVAARDCTVFSGPPIGLGMLSAGLILAVMVTPFISSVAREVLKAVPRAQREGAYALGATRWEAIRVALSYGRTGIVGAIMLGFGRALGETMAVTMVIGNSPTGVVVAFPPQYTMAAVIANEFTEATDDLHLHALIEIGLVLFVITLVVNALSRMLIWSMNASAASGKSKPNRLPWGCRMNRMTAPGGTAARLAHRRRAVRAVGAGRAGPARVHPVLRRHAEASQALTLGLLHATCRSPSARRAAAWRTRSSAR